MWSQKLNRTDALSRIAVLGNHLPRQCGIATFTTHIADALSEHDAKIDCFVLAMNDTDARYAYPSRVRFEIAESDLSSYRRAADFLNVNQVDVLSVQHEYGIFGGKAGAHVFALLRELRMPIVTTLHTVLGEPSPAQRASLEELAQLSDRLIVMSTHGAALLRDVYAVPSSKIDVIPHGIPAVPESTGSKDRLGVEGRPVILTMGLISPDKGIEYVIEALPTILQQFPRCVYVVLGATHPHVKAHAGESYRLSLEQRARALGADDALIFHNRFVSQEELNEFLAAADIYITPYLQPEQITSGTLAYAVGAGKAVVSTPYRYARELLADGRGILVPSRDASAIAHEVIGLLEDEPKRRALGARAAAHGRDMTWPAVARQYMSSFHRARREHAERRRTRFQAQTLASRPATLPEVNLSHLRLMTDDAGILQHARFSVPRYSEGYCLDDNARGLLLMALLDDEGVEDRAAVRALAVRYLAFIEYAYDPERARFRNFLSYDRRWLEDEGSEDSHGRALWALGATVGRSPRGELRTLAGELFTAALPVVSSFTSPRAWAFALLGVSEYLGAFDGDRRVQALGLALAERLLGLLTVSSRDNWYWFEDSVTYCNAHLPQALLATGAWTGRDDLTRAGLRSLEWLASIQRSPSGVFAPVGSNGFYTRDSKMAAFDQQPVEAYAMVSACVEAQRVDANGPWARHARHAFDWFLGGNHLQHTLYDPSTGGCRDGLHAERANENQGAESTLAFLLALIELRVAQRADAGVPSARMVTH
jgi:glycosyltransferase involved in cell wall biosynthesis